MSGGRIALSVRRCSGAAAALLQLHAGLPALAQEEPAGTGEGVEEIVVVGSHLPRARLDGPAPVDVFDAAALQSSGVNTLADFARHLTYNVGVPNDEQAALSSAPGTSFFNLRGIGAQGTLTLVNGRRIAPHGAPQANGKTFVDLNSIPFAAIERIEVLKDGASALYGSEAVAGVVNVVLKRRQGVSPPARSATGRIPTPTGISCSAASTCG